MLKYLDPKSAIVFLSTEKQYYDNQLLWHLLCDQLNITNSNTFSLIESSREKVVTATKKLNFICMECGSHLDSIFGFFLFSKRKCFDCKRNKLAHSESYDPSFTLVSDETDHYVENFGIQFKNVPISGELVLNAYGCSLGGGSYFLFQKNGDLAKSGEVAELAMEIYKEKEFFERHISNYSDDVSTRAARAMRYPFCSCLPTS